MIGARRRSRYPLTRSAHARSPATARQLAAARGGLLAITTPARRRSIAGLAIEVSFKLYLITDRRLAAARGGLLAITAAALAAAPSQASSWKRTSSFI
jgi:hypothetical protein